MTIASRGCDWNDTTIGRLRHLWSEGVSASEIGRQIGVSKNAVVGKAHRIGLPTRPSPIRRDAQTSPRPAARRTIPKLADIAPVASVPAALPARVAITAPLPVPIVARPTPEQPPPDISAPASCQSQAALRRVPCCWPLGEPDTTSFRFCDDPAITGKPYCPAHYSLAYRTVRLRARAAADAVTAAVWP